VLIADPYSLFRQALRRCLDDRPELRVVAEVKSPGEYRRVRASLEYDVAIVASDLLTGTHSTAPLHADDYHLDDEETAAGGATSPLTIVLVADEDVGAAIAGPAQSEIQHGSQRYYIPRSAPSEALIDTIVTLHHKAGGNTDGL
jgi:hypothetical protein